MPFAGKTRLLALLMLLCCGWLDFVGSFLHTDALPEKAQPSVTAALVCTDSAAATAAALTARSKAKPSHHCAICEVQAATLSPALLPFAFHFPGLPQTRIMTASPRAPSVRTRFASSRAPPIA